MHEDRAIEADDVPAELHHRTPPGILHVPLELHAQRTEIPGRARSAVDLARREDEASPLGERGELLRNVLRWGVLGGRSHADRLHETRAGCLRSRSSSMRRAVAMSRSITYRRNARRCRSSSWPSVTSSRRRAAVSRSLTSRYRSDFSARTERGATELRRAAHAAQIAPPAAGSHAFVASASGLRHCAQTPSSGRKPERSRRCRSNHRHTTGADVPASSDRRALSSRSNSGAEGTRSAVKRSTSSATYHPAAMSARLSRISR